MAKGLDIGQTYLNNKEALQMKKMIMLYWNCARKMTWTMMNIVRGFYLK